MTVYWTPFLHAYQPPWQDVDILMQIYDECYMPLLSMMERHKNMKITLNIQGCLLDQFSELNLDKSREIARKLIAQGKMELVGSAKFHPILPLIPKSEIHRQIEMNRQTLNHHFPSSTRKGFFPPEMAVSPKLCRIVKEEGFSWMLQDGIANKAQWPYNYIQQTESGLLALFRDTYISNMIAFQAIDAKGFVDHIQHVFPHDQDHDIYFITAMDAETFGHHIKYYETSFLGKAFSLIEDNPNITPCFISDLPDLFPIKPVKTINSSSWSTDGNSLASNVPYPLWQHPLNPVHKYQYRMMKALYSLMDLLESEKKLTTKNGQFRMYYKTARHFYDRALHSCWRWWASMSPMWSPNLIYKGIDLVVKTALNAQLALINIKIGRGEEFYARILDNSEKLMNELIEQEAKGQQVHTFGDEINIEKTS